MKLLYLFVCVLVTLACSTPTASTFAQSQPPLVGDALFPPPPAYTTRSTGTAPDRYTPSAFLAGKVAVRLVFVESDGKKQTSTEDWTDTQRTLIRSQVQSALDWWAARLPNANLSFVLTTVNASTGYEPITLTLNEEKQWAGEALASLGFAGTNYFEQAYSAADTLRRENRTDWATTIFVVNSEKDADGRFADGQFAYAYVGGPFLVVTSDAATYSTNRLAPVVAHEFGHIFGALDQYEVAATPCTVRSGYLGVANTNSQYRSCGTKFASIMWDPVSAFQSNAVDGSALGQLGYRDSDGDALPDPLDTAPTLDVTINQNGSGRPHIQAHATDQPYPSSLQRSMSINTIARIEFRMNDGDWTTLPAADGVYDNIEEAVDATLPLYDGTYTVELWAINRVGAASPVVTQQVQVHNVGTQPDVTISVPTLQNTNKIAIGVNAPTDFEIRVSETPDGDMAWRPVQPQHLFTLAPTEGEHVLYIGMRDGQGLEMPLVVRHVTLDSTAPTGSALLEGPHDDTLVIQAEDTGSGIESMAIIDQNGTDGPWQSFTATVPLTPHAIPSAVRLRDRAGNVSAPLAVQQNNAVYIPLAME